MSILSGKNGTLYVGGSEVTPLSDWRLTVASRNFEYVANDTGGWSKRVAGAKDCSGLFAVAVKQDSACPVAEGAAVTLKLHVDSSGDNYYEVPAMIDKIEIAVDVSDGETVGYAIHFSANGPMIAHGILAA
jgi:hypothetical protein